MAVEAAAEEHAEQVAALDQGAKLGDLAAPGVDGEGDRVVVALAAGAGAGDVAEHAEAIVAERDDLVGAAPLAVEELPIDDAAARKCLRRELVERRDHGVG